MTSPIHPDRIRALKKVPHTAGNVVYWMSRDQRVDDNWALLFAQSLAFKYKTPLAVVFCVVPGFLGATIRQYGFMLRGLKEIEVKLSKKNISFHLLLGDPQKEIPSFAAACNVSNLVIDFNPLTVHRQWKEFLHHSVHCSVYEVDAHNIVPCWSASEKQEFAAYTFRPKIHGLLPVFLDEFQSVRRHPYAWRWKVIPNDWEKANASLTVDQTVREIDWIQPGEAAAKKRLFHFIHSKLSLYDEHRNDPTMNAQSDFSPHLHFGHIAAQRIALDIVEFSGKDIHELMFRNKNGASNEHGSTSAFLEELIVRRELSDNFAHYNMSYASFAGFPAWAQQSLHEHRGDRREFLYSSRQFEYGETHDELWNAAQWQMTSTGKMHGYLRMYWAKKILEWSPSPEEAHETAIYLNDKYELDGRDPNGYAGIAWSIGGVHDRAWFDRPVFGKIRYMNYNGCKSKFDVGKYIAQIKLLR